jgi:hypothetical protein
LALVVGISLPMVAYEYYVFWTDPLFAARVHVATPSANIGALLMGLGLPLLPALFVVPVAVFGLRRRRIFLVCWMFAAILLPYVPVPFQRKLLMGVHIPLSMLAAYGLVQFRWFRFKHRLPAILAGIFLLTGATNVLHIVSDIRIVRQDARLPGSYGIYVSAAEMRPIRWLARHAAPESRILCMPSMGLIVPALAPCRVYAGHWGETPDYGVRRVEAVSVLMGRRGTEGSDQLIHNARIDYIVQPLAFLSPENLPDEYREPVPSAEGYAAFLAGQGEVYRDGMYAIYRTSASGGRR